MKVQTTIKAGPDGTDIDTEPDGHGRWRIH